MPRITDPPPPAIAAELSALRTDLDDHVPRKALDRNLIMATWNIRAFGDLTEKWMSEAGDSPKRDLHSLACIAEIVSRFDVVALQEVKRNLKALRHLLKLLGPNWGLILTDVTRGDSGNGERMAFVYDSRKVKLSGLACELVVPRERLIRIAPDALERQFARTPYAVSFQANSQTFILVTLHVLYGRQPEERTPELKAIADWLSEWARDVHAWHHNLVALGDFNIDRRNDERYRAFISSGLHVPEDLQHIPRTIFSEPKFYDQIAWFSGRHGLPELSMKYLRGGIFDFTRTALCSRALNRVQLSWRLSDHYPLWAEFSIRD
jgi:endonuclease/exonuclease/phosphatase family metal-dependent hydrolase